MIAQLLAAILVVYSAGPPSGTSGPGPEVYRFRHLRLVALDPGHGGRNTGCLGVDGTYEKVVVLDIARRVERILTEETSAAVLLTRRDDRYLSLSERSALANSWEADVFLSLHLNSDVYGRGAGVETWFLAAEGEASEGHHASDGGDGHTSHAGKAVASAAKPSGAVDNPGLSAVLDALVQGKAQQDSELLARAVAQSLWKHTGAIYRGVKQARFGVLKAARMPSIVVESGFFSHHKEGWKLLEAAYQEKIAHAIVDGLIAYDKQVGGSRPIELSAL